MDKSTAKIVLLTGGAGYIGLHLTLALEKAGYRVVVLDNLSTGHKHPILKDKLVQGDVGDKKILSQLFTTYQFDIIIHLAALIDVNGSINEPIKYYENNVSQTLTLLDFATQHQVKYFIFASSAAIFSHTPCTPIDEQYPTHPATPYGRSKCLLECVLKDCYTAHGLNSIIFRYFNVAGADPETNLINSQKKWVQLIPALLQAVKMKDGEFTMFGDQYETPDGSCLRDYIHVNDICSAHLCAIEKLTHLDGCFTYNLGTGEGFSVKQVIQEAKVITQKPIKTITAPARSADSPCVIANSSLAQSALGWSPKSSSLTIMIESLWKWLKQ